MVSATFQGGRQRDLVRSWKIVLTSSTIKGEVPFQETQGKVTSGLFTSSQERKLNDQGVGPSLLSMVKVVSVASPLSPSFPLCKGAELPDFSGLREEEKGEEVGGSAVQM